MFFYFPRVFNVEYVLFLSGSLHFRLEELQIGDNEIHSIDHILRLPRLRTLSAARNLITNFGVLKINSLEQYFYDSVIFQT